MISQNIFLLPIIFLLSLVLTYFYIQIAEKKGLKDVPNERSLHERPTPRGGGVSIIILTALSLLLCFKSTSNLLFLILFATSLFIAAIGFLDDLRGLSAKIRLSVHLISPIIFLYFLSQNADFITLGGFKLPFNWIFAILLTLYISWGINFYNFMDGIDGLASLQALFVGLSLSFFSYISGLENISFVYLAIAISSLGFYFFNKSPAKVFMGDASSGFLGFIFASLSVFTAAEDRIPLFTSMILMNAFIMDATLTLLSRASQKLPVYSAHRDHIYQHLTVIAKSHSKISGAYLLFNTLILFPAAYWSFREPSLALPLWIVTGLPWIFLAIKYKAGIKAN